MLTGTLDAITVADAKLLFLKALDQVPEPGIEPGRLAAGDFKSPASTVPPLRHLDSSPARLTVAAGGRGPTGSAAVTGPPRLRRFE